MWCGRTFTRHAPCGQPRMRTATRDVPNDVAVWSDEWRPEDEKQGDAERAFQAKSSRECAEWLAVSRRLAYRRVPLHSEVSCRCGLTGSLCAHLRCFCCCYRCRPIPLPLHIVESSAAAHIGDNATCTITDTSSRARHRAPANELNYFRAAAIHRTRLRGTRTLDRSISRDK